MKNIRTNIDKWLESLDKRWDEIPAARQRRYILHFFAAYLLLTAGVIGDVWCDTANAANTICIRHIESPKTGKAQNPAVLQDTLTKMLKNKLYEKK